MRIGNLTWEVPKLFTRTLQMVIRLILSLSLCVVLPVPSVLVFCLLFAQQNWQDCNIECEGNTYFLRLCRTNFKEFFLTKLKNSWTWNLKSYLKKPLTFVQRKGTWFLKFKCSLGLNLTLHGSRHLLYDSECSLTT